MRQISVPEVLRIKSDRLAFEKGAFFLSQHSHVIRPALGTRMKVHETKDATDE